MANRTADVLPRVRQRRLGRLLFNLAQLIGGLFIFAVAQVFMLQCNLGAGSWTVLSDGISRHTPLTIGMATQITGLLMLFVAWRVGVRPGIGTLANMVLVGVFMDLLIWAAIVPEARGLPEQLLLLASGILTLGLASALYIRAGFGAGPRDSFMLGVVQRTRLRVGVVRWGMELSAAATGILLGGEFGPGTIAFAMLVGFAVDFFFTLLRVRVVPAAGTRAKAPTAP